MLGCLLKQGRDPWLALNFWTRNPDHLTDINAVQIFNFRIHHPEQFHAIFICLGTITFKLFGNKDGYGIPFLDPIWGRMPFKGLRHAGIGYKWNGNNPRGLFRKGVPGDFLKRNQDVLSRTNSVNVTNVRIQSFEYP